VDSDLKIGGTPRTAIQMREEELWQTKFTKKISVADEDGDLEVPRGLLLGIYQTGIPAT
jgi:hypothetical protein